MAARITSFKSRMLSFTEFSALRRRQASVQQGSATEKGAPPAPRSRARTAGEAAVLSRAGSGGGPTAIAIALGEAACVLYSYVYTHSIMPTLAGHHAAGAALGPTARALDVAAFWGSVLLCVASLLVSTRSVVRALTPTATDAASASLATVLLHAVRIVEIAVALLQAGLLATGAASGETDGVFFCVYLRCLRATRSTGSEADSNIYACYYFGFFAAGSLGRGE